jgi:hypothetical protein
MNAAVPLAEQPEKSLGPFSGLFGAMPTLVIGMAPKIYELFETLPVQSLNKGLAKP